MRTILLLSLSACMIALPASYGIFHRVESANQRIQQLRHEIDVERESVQVLRAEFAYLNRGERLAELADRYHQSLLLEPVLPLQLAPGPVRSNEPAPSPRVVEFQQ